MIATGSLAFANARVRALKSRLLGRETGGRLLAGLAVTHDRPDPSLGFHELLDWYALVLASYPGGRALVGALLRRHELENIKVAWRSIVNRHAEERWLRHWLPLERLASVRLDDVRGCRTLAALVEALERTPYAAIAHAMWRAHASDPLAAEVGFDRWASRAIVTASDALPAGERTAKALATALVLERDFSILRRSLASGLTPETLSGALACLPLEIDAVDLMRLATWSPAEGPLWRAMPRQYQRGSPAAGDWDQWLLWWRRRRRALCRRAFLESPFCLAPAIALLLLKEEEIRGLDAMNAFETLPGAATALEYALAPSELGA